jgi:CRP-like cAMP-binding protein
MNLFGKEKIEKLTIFDGIDSAVVDEVLANAKKSSFAAGETIMEQGDHPNATGYIIESGSVEVSIDGDQKTTLSSGEMFGEIALLNEEPRSATVIAKSDTIVVEISQDILFEMINNDDNSINKEIMRRMEENLEAE